MGGVSHLVNVPATLRALRSKRLKILDVEAGLRRQILMSILNGSVHAADKFHRVGAADSNLCQWCHDGRQTFSHLWWGCFHFNAIRSPFLDTQQAAGWSARQILLNHCRARYADGYRPVEMLWHRL